MTPAYHDPTNAGTVVSIEVGPHTTTDVTTGSTFEHYIWDRPRYNLPEPYLVEPAWWRWYDCFRRWPICIISTGSMFTASRKLMFRLRPITPLKEVCRHKRRVFLHALNSG